MTSISGDEINSLDVLLQQLAMTIRRQIANIASAYDLTVAQYLALMTIYRSDSYCTMSELADNTMQISATMTGIINRLENRGWVKRELDPSDRRVWRVNLTPDGKHQLEQLEAERRKLTEQVLCQFTTQEQQTLHALVDKYLAITIK
ncbi:MAG: MarR family transcriptional regulator [Chloroflexi bacterium]|nr:MAG: MarR family transcriptional regulator [Chloroflexota bacterium]